MWWANACRELMWFSPTLTLYPPHCILLSPLYPSVSHCIPLYSTLELYPQRNHSKCTQSSLFTALLNVISLRFEQNVLPRIRLHFFVSSFFCASALLYNSVDLYFCTLEHCERYDLCSCFFLECTFLKITLLCNVCFARRIALDIGRVKIVVFCTAQRCTLGGLVRSIDGSTGCRWQASLLHWPTPTGLTIKPSNNYISTQSAV